MNRGITEVTVERLFGRYDYNIRLANDDDAEPPRISLLYGDNGTGKTTILKLVFHLLSSGQIRGHQAFVARVPFRRFSILFSDQTMVSAFRSGIHSAGGFDLELRSSDGHTESARFEADTDSDVVPSRSTLLKTIPLLRKISASTPDVFYLGDDRTLESDTLSVQSGVFFQPETLALAGENVMPATVSRIRRNVRERRFLHSGEGNRFTTEGGPNEQLESALAESIRRTERRLEIEVIQASSMGEADARQSYAEILRTIASARAPAGIELDEEKARLKRELEELESISGKFATFGLGSVIDASSLSESLANADERTLPVVIQVLGSFLEGQRARLNALDAIYEKMHNFVATSNEYLIDKTVELDILSGLTIHIPGDELDPDHLSSGEKHLLLLFLNVFTSSEQPQLFIIDEPELSLNVKWQRRLVDSLLNLTRNTQCQFLLATHSIELLSKHMDHVVRLAP